MVDVYSSAILRVLEAFWNRLAHLALPIALFSGILLAALYIKERDQSIPRLKTLVPYALGALLCAFLWTMLRSIREIERNSMAWQEQAEATAKPQSDAPLWYQYSPSAVMLQEKTYTRTLTLPPDFAQRIGTDGLGILAPYLSDPTSENVLKMVDSFRRNGQDVLFTREVTRMDESPIGFDNADITVGIKRTQEVGFEATFVGKYKITNPDQISHELRFVFPISTSGGTVHDLSLKVGSEVITEPDEQGNFVWRGEVAPGESRTITVSLVTDGSSQFAYDLGSTRRSVRNFQLVATVDGAYRFPRGTIQPVSHTNNSVTWKLTNVVTAQRASLAFPKDTFVQDGYLQALASLPLTFAFVLAVFALCSNLSGLGFSISGLNVLAIVYGGSLLAIPIAFGYIGIIPVLVFPILGAFVAGIVGNKSSAYPMMVVSLIPAAMLSPTHSGMLVMLLLVVSGSILYKMMQVKKEN